MARPKRIAIGIMIVAGAVVMIVLLIILYRSYSNPILVPNVMRLTLDQATSTLERADLALGEVRYVATGNIAEGLVVDQSPGMSESVRRGDEIDVTVAVAPVNAEVPDVLGLEVEEAERLLSDALYEVNGIEVFDDARDAGVVIDQLPEEGTEWLTGRPVGIAVSAGPDDGTGIVVPDVIGEGQVNAELTLKDLDLIPLSFVVTIQGTEGRNVILQLPDAGTRVPPGTTVLLLFTLK